MAPLGPNDGIGREAHQEDVGVVRKARGSPETTNCGGDRRPAARKMTTIRRTEGVLAGATRRG
jgi:hypothetical protein